MQSTLARSAAQCKCPAPARACSARPQGPQQRSLCAAQATRREAHGLVASLAVTLAGAALPGPAAAYLEDGFVDETRALAKTMNDYMTLDPFDKERLAALKTIKEDGKKWIAAHARGGSAPGQAAKRMYVAVDAILGHAAANGAAPLPKGKVKQVQATLNEVESLLEASK